MEEDCGSEQGFRTPCHVFLQKMQKAYEHFGQTRSLSSSSGGATGL